MNGQRLSEKKKNEVIEKKNNKNKREGREKSKVEIQ